LSEIASHDFHNTSLNWLTGSDVTYWYSQAQDQSLQQLILRGAIASTACWVPVANQSGNSESTHEIL